MLEQLINSVHTKKARLDSLRPQITMALAELQKQYDIELTYASNAIEGNTLTLRETAEVIEHGISVGGKPLHDHLEATDHYNALLWMRDVAATAAPIDDTTLCELHRRVVARSQPEAAGRYSQFPRRIAGSAVIFPNPVKIPSLMMEFGAWLRAAPPTTDTAFDAHFRLTAIHPFSDGNGRTARLLMNLFLLRSGYPPMAIRPEDRKIYLDDLEHASVTDDMMPYRLFMYQRLDATLDEYLRVV